MAQRPDIEPGETQETAQHVGCFCSLCVPPFQEEPQAEKPEEKADDLVEA